MDIFAPAVQRILKHNMVSGLYQAPAANLETVDGR